MILRYLAHDGVHYYFTGTDGSGDPQWTTTPSAAFLYTSEAAATRMMARCIMDGLDMELVTL